MRKQKFTSASRSIYDQHCESCLHQDVIRACLSYVLSMGVLLFCVFYTGEKHYANQSNIGVLMTTEQKEIAKSTIPYFARIAHFTNREKEWYNALRGQKMVLPGTRPRQMLMTVPGINVSLRLAKLAAWNQYFALVACVSGVNCNGAFSAERGSI